jgi:hypothetical protein
MDTREEWASAIDRVVTEVLASVRGEAPPVDAFAVAGLGIEVLLDRGQAARGRQKRVLGRGTIFVRPDPRPERLQWAVAHEVGEQMAYRAFRELGVSSDEVSPPTRERAANCIAARLLMPTAWFEADAAECGYDLLELKRRYRTASHEAIALRLLDLPDAMLLSVFDHNRLSWRRSNVAVRAPRLHPEERRCQEQVHRSNRAETIDAAALVIHGWPVHETGWKREILRTTAAYDLDFGMEEEPSPWNDPRERWEATAPHARDSLLPVRVKGPVRLVQAAQEVGDQQGLGEDRGGAVIHQCATDRVARKVGYREDRHARVRGAVGAELIDPAV